MQGLPWWAWLVIAFGVGFLVEWVMEVFWYRRKRMGDDARFFSMQTELDAAHKEVGLVRGGSEMLGLKSDLNAATAGRASIEGQLKSANFELGDIKGKFGKLQVDFDKLKGEHNLKVGEIATLGAGATVAAASLKAKDAELGKLKLDGDGALKAKDAELGKLKLDWEGRLKAKDAEIGTLRVDWENKLKAKDLELGSLKADYDGKLKLADENHGKTRTMFAALQGDFGKVQANTGSLQMDFDKLKTDHGNKVAEIATLTAGAAVAAAAIKAKNIKVGELESIIELKDARLGELTADLKAKEQDWSTRISTLKGDFDNTANVRGNLETSLKARDLELTDARTNITQLNTAKLGLEKTVGDLQAQVGDLRMQLGNLQGERNTLLNARADLEGKLKLADDDHGKTRTLFAALQGDFGKVQTNTGGLQTEFDSLKADHKTKVGEIATLAAGATVAAVAIKAKDGEIGKLSANVTELSSVRGKLEGTVKDLQAEVGGLRAKIGTLQGDYDKLSAARADLEGKLKLADDDHGKTRTLFAALQDDFGKVQTNTGGLQTELDSLKADHKGKVAEIATLAAGATAAAAALKAKDAELGKLKLDWEGQVKAKDAELGKLKNEHGSKVGEIATLAAGATAAAVAIKAKDGEIGNLSANVAELSGVRGKLEGTVKDLQAEVGGLRAKIGSLQGDYDKLSAARADLEGKLKLADDDHGKTRTLFAALQGDFGQLKTDHGSASGELGTLRGRIGELESTLKAKDLSLTDWNTRFSTLQSDLAKLQANNAKLDADLKAASAARANLEGTLKTREGDVADVNTRIAALQAEYNKLKNEHGGKVGEIATLVAGAGAAATSIQHKDNEINLLKAQVTEISGALQASSAERANLENQLKGKNADVANWSSKFTTLKGDFDQTLTVRSNVENTLKTREKELADALARLEQIKGEHEQLNGKRAGLEADLARVNDVRSTLETHLKARDAQLATLQAELAAGKDAQRGSSSQIATLTSGAAAAGATLKAREQELGQVNARLGALENELATMRQAKGDLDATLKAKDKDINDARWRLGELEAESAKLRAASIELQAAYGRVKDLEGELAELHSKPAPAANFLVGKDFASNAATQTGVAIVRSACPQHLSEIDGIGSVFEQRLYDAGIGTFWELSNLGDDDMKRILDVPTGGKRQVLKVDYAAMRATAARMAEKTQAVGRAWSGGQADDLEPIDGIGHTFELRLYDAGICTVEAIANSTVARLAEVCQAPKNFKRPQYACWIAQARTLLNLPIDAALEAACAEAKAMSNAKPATLLSKSFADDAATAAGVKSVRSECPQHLSEVKGIGTVFEQRLFEYGIGTYWELAHMSDSDLRDALKLDDIAAASKTGARMVKVDFEAIRTDALKMAKESDTQGRTWGGGDPDDFEPIEGIGHTFELRLYNAGICTYAALVNTTDERLAEICNPPKRFKTPNYASWRAQATILLEKKTK